VFGSVELLLGGGTDAMTYPSRKLTDVEKSLVRNVLRIVLADFGDVWSGIAAVQFEVQSVADEPMALNVLTPAEAVVAVSLEVKMGAATSMVNMAIPSIFVKRLRDRFERLQTVQQTEAQRDDQVHMAKLLQQVPVELEVRVDGGMVPAEVVAELDVGDVLEFDHSSERALAALVNGRQVYMGKVAAVRDHLTLVVEQRAEPDAAPVT
jgi:flagellar motor switch protein FliM